jgi:hypothetical protein
MPVAPRLSVALLAALLICWHPGAQAESTPGLGAVLEENPVDVQAAPVTFGDGQCTFERGPILLGSRYITLVVDLKPKARCVVGGVTRESTLETPEQTLPWVATYADGGMVLAARNGGGHSSLVSGKAYIVFESKGTSAESAKRVVFNAAGQREPLPWGKSNRYSQSAFLWSIFRAQDEYRAQDLIRRAQAVEAEGGLPAYLVKLNGQFPGLPLVRQLFQKATPLPDNACSQGIFKTMAKLIGNIKTPALQFDADLSHAAYDVANYRSAAGLAQLNQTPNLDYPDHVPAAGQAVFPARGLAVLPSEDCKQAFVKADFEGPMKEGYKYGETAYAEIQADFTADFIQGSVRKRYFSGNSIMERRPFAGALPAIDFMCTQSQCYAGSLEDVFKQGALKSTDAWPPEQKAQIATLEQQRDHKQAQARRERDAREAKEAAERKQADAEAAKRQQIEERAFNSAMGAKDPQAMYMAAGKYDREGESGKATMVYERLIARFGSSPWAVKANDQLLQNQRVNAVNSSNRRSSEAAGERAVNACRSEVSACYDRGGKDCARSCESLR